MQFQTDKFLFEHPALLGETKSNKHHKTNIKICKSRAQYQDFGPVILTNPFLTNIRQYADECSGKEPFLPYDIMHDNRQDITIRVVDLD